MGRAKTLSKLNNLFADEKRWSQTFTAVFWVLGLFSGGILTYTTRHYVNGDAIAYLDMAEAFRKGVWDETVLLGYSPGYSILLAIFQYIVPSSPDYELFVAKIFNFLIFILAMAVCDRFVNRLIDESRVVGKSGSLPAHAIKALCFSVFLVAAMVWIRIQIIAPDMLVFVFVLLSLMAIFDIRRSPEGLSSFAWLGLASGLGYVCKTFFFPFSVLLFALGGLHCRSLTKAIPRVFISMAVLLIVSAPVVISQSLKAGQFSIGEVGSYNYAYYVAGSGSPVHLPKTLHIDPDVLFYDRGVLSTFPHGDPAYWALGIKPVLDIEAQSKAIAKNVLDLMAQIWAPMLIMLGWFFAQFRNATFPVPTIRPPSLFVTLMLACLAGTGIYCMVSMEIRYVAAFLFVGSAALVIAPEYNNLVESRQKYVVAEAVLVSLFMTGMVIYFVVDQSHRALYYSNSKISHRGSFLEMIAVKNFLNDNNVVKRDKIAVFYPVNDKIYWARMAGARAVGEILNVESFIRNTPLKRSSALSELEKAGFKAVVVKQPQFIGLVNEGWNKVPETLDYYVFFLSGAH